MDQQAAYDLAVREALTVNLRPVAAAPFPIGPVLVAALVVGGLVVGFVKAWPQWPVNP